MATSPSENPPGMAPTPAIPALTTPVVGSSSTTSQPATGVLPDTANATKFYTITASLREEYDDNIFTSRSNKTASAVTEFSPSILVDFPMSESLFEARYTFGFDYYANSSQPYEYTHEGLIRYTHQFSDRFSLDVRDQAGYYTQPDLLNAVGTVFRNGEYYENIATAQFSAQWTPLFGTLTDYSNTALLYNDQAISQFQNYDENTISNDFRFAFFPKYNYVLGLILDHLDYFEDARGYTEYTVDTGIDWQALPNLSVSVRGGATMLQAQGVPSSINPYASVSVDWHLGKRSELTFTYLHNVVPTDVFNAVGQDADRFSVRFSYDITARLSAYFDSTLTHSEYTSSLLQDNVPGFSEDDLGLDLGLTYHINANFSIEGGYLLSDISSQEDVRDYTRNQVYIGVRGTY